MSSTWAFSISSNVATDSFGHSHLDVCVRFPRIDAGDDLLSFHLLAVPLFEESHSGASLFASTAKILMHCVQHGGQRLLALQPMVLPIRLDAMSG